MENELRENLESIKSQLIELRRNVHEKRGQVEEEYDRAFDACPRSSETRYFMALFSRLTSAEKSLGSAINYLDSALGV